MTKLTSKNPINKTPTVPEAHRSDETHEKETSTTEDILGLATIKTKTTNIYIKNSKPPRQSNKK